MSSDIKFVMIKASQGVSFHDPLFQTYWKTAKAKGLYHGAYHFLTATATAQEQADNYFSEVLSLSLLSYKSLKEKDKQEKIKTLFSSPFVLPPVLDVEDQVPAALNVNITKNKGAFIQLVTDWINIVEKATGRKVIIYSYKNFFVDYLNNHSWPNSYLWLASYQLKEPGLPKGYSKWDFWQNSERGKIDGELTGGEIDLDVFRGSVEELAKL
jgi:lysozyme